MSPLLPPRRPSVVAWATALVAMATACSTKAPSPPICSGATDAEACFSAHYLTGPAAEVRSCAAPPAAVAGRRRLVVHLGATISDDDAAAETRSLAAYFKPYDLTFFVREAAASVPFTYAMTGDDAEVERRARARGIPTSDEAALRQIAGEVIGENIRTFLHDHGGDTNLVHVVVLPQIVAPALAKQFKGTVVGLGIAPNLLRTIAETDPDRNLFTLLALPDDFPPTLFIGHDDIAKAGPIVGRIVAAHEMGHALGLVHTTDATNLMYPRVATSSSCAPPLAAAQVEALDAVTVEVDVALDAAERIGGAVRSLATAASLGGRTEP